MYYNDMLLNDPICWYYMFLKTKLWLNLTSCCEIQTYLWRKKKKHKYFPKNIHVFKEGLWVFHRMHTISPGAEFSPERFPLMYGSLHLSDTRLHPILGHEHLWECAHPSVRTSVQLLKTGAKMRDLKQFILSSSVIKMDFRVCRKQFWD